MLDEKVRRKCHSSISTRNQVHRTRRTTNERRRKILLRIYTKMREIHIYSKQHIVRAKHGNITNLIKKEKKR